MRRKPRRNSRHESKAHGLNISSLLFYGAIQGVFFLPLLRGPDAHITKSSWSVQRLNSPQGAAVKHYFSGPARSGSGSTVRSGDLHLQRSVVSEAVREQDP